MTRSSCITHSTRQQLVLIRQDYLELCKGDHCAAALLNVFEYWTNVKLSAAEQAKIDNEIAQYEGLEPTQDTELWIYKRVPDFQAELLDLFGEKKVTTGLQFLKDNGFIQTRNNPKYKWDKTLQYLLNTEALNCAIRDRKNAVSKKSKRALNARKNAAAIPEITTEATTEKKKSPKPPKGAGKAAAPKAYPDSYELRKWSDTLVNQALVEFDETIHALLMAWGDSDLYPTARNMLKRDQLKYIETARGLIKVGCLPARFQSLAVYTRATLSWRNNPLTVTDMLGQYSNWLKAQQKRITLEVYETPAVDDYPRTDDYLQVDGLGNWIGGSK